MSIRKNFFYNISYQLLVMFLPIFTTPYISRVIGAEGIGIYSYTYSIINYFMLFAMLGISSHGSRSIASVRDDKKELSRVFWSIYIFQFSMTTIMLIIYIIYILLFVTTNTEIFYIQIIFLITTVFDISWLFFGLEQFRLTVIRNTVIKILTVVCIFIFVRSHTDLWIYTLIMALGMFISQSVLWLFINQYIKIVRITFKDILVHIKPSLILFIPILAVSLYKIMDKIMLGSMTDALQVGYYENAEKIINIPLSIISALGVVMVPRMTNLYSKGSPLAANYIEKSLKFVMFMTIGASIGLIAVAPTFIPVFLGEEFNQCIFITQLLAISLLFICWANVIRTQYLVPKKRDAVYIKSTFLGAIVNMLINFILIPRHGVIGACIGTIFAEASVCLYQTYVVRKELDIYTYLNNARLFIIPTIIMYLLIVVISNYLKPSILAISLQVIIGGLTYLFLCVVSIKILSKKSHQVNTNIYSTVIKFFS